MSVTSVIADKGYNDKKPLFVRECLLANSTTPARLTDIHIWKTHGRYKKQMRKEYNKQLYHQHIKVETIFSIIKGMFGECIRSTKIKTRKRELIFRCIAYNMHRYAKLIAVTMVSIQPIHAKVLILNTKNLADKNKNIHHIRHLSKFAPNPI